jgi:2-methylisocitrate lyase-like PEP mutase family enzyme
MGKQETSIAMSERLFGDEFEAHVSYRQEIDKPEPHSAWQLGERPRPHDDEETMKTTIEKRATFRALHAEGCFVIPNPWDIGSARLLQHLGFGALASTSSGFAWSTGRPDYGIARDEVLEHLRTLAAAVDIPVNADFETGFADDPAGVHDNVAAAVATGVAGLSIEDRTLAGGLHDKAAAVERIRAARAAIDASGEDVLLVARAEVLLTDPSQVTAAIDKLVAFAVCGADCLYAPGLTTKDDIAAVVRAVAPKPVNVLMATPRFTVAELADLGVRRVSVGGAMARVAWAALIRAAEQMKNGSFDGLDGAASGAELNRMFGA